MLVTLAAFVLSGPVLAGEPVQDNQWTFSITPYLWLPNINCDLKYSIPPGASGSPDVEVGPNDYLESLNAVLMITGEVRRERFLAFTDYIYLDFSDEDGTVEDVDFGGSLISVGVSGSTESSFRGAAWTLAGGYAVVPGRPVDLNAFGGFRYFGIKASTGWRLELDVAGPGDGQTFPRTGDISEREDLWDGIVGIKGRCWLGDSNWAIPYYLDAGTGSSRLTWQGMLGIAYSYEWFGATLTYRHISYDMKDDALIQDLRFSGPALGATFRF